MDPISSYNERVNIVTVNKYINDMCLWRMQEMKHNAAKSLCAKQIYRVLNIINGNNTDSLNIATAIRDALHV